MNTVMRMIVQACGEQNRYLTYNGSEKLGY